LEPPKLKTARRAGSRHADHHPRRDRHNAISGRLLGKTRSFPGLSNIRLDRTANGARPKWLALQLCDGLRSRGKGVHGRRRPKRTRRMLDGGPRSQRGEIGQRRLSVQSFRQQPCAPGGVGAVAARADGFGRRFCSSLGPRKSGGFRSLGPKPGTDAGHLFLLTLTIDNTFHGRGGPFGLLAYPESARCLPSVARSRRSYWNCVSSGDGAARRRASCGAA